ncbi:MAG TPA: hypothetical protein VGM56_27025 [Byssovorax sp.]|jgi:hypothetical protein
MSDSEARDGDDAGKKVVAADEGIEGGEKKVDDKAAKASDDALAAAAEKKAEKSADEATKQAEETAADAKAEHAGDGDATEAAAAEDAAEKEVEEAAAPPPKRTKKAAAKIDEPASTRGTVAGVIALVILLGGILGAVFLMRRNDDARAKQVAAQQRRRGPGKQREPAWTIGQKVPVSLTVLADDAENLECVSPTEIDGMHCAWEAKGKPWSGPAGAASAAPAASAHAAASAAASAAPAASGEPSAAEPTDDAKLLRPYSTTARQKLIAGGLWSQLKAPLPSKRFTVKCTFEVLGKIDKPSVRFAKGREFHDVKEGWFAGRVTDCTIVPPK